jgi:hypothetical protein
LLSCLVQEGEKNVCLGGTSKTYTVAKVVNDSSEASASSGVPLSETPTSRGAILPFASEPRI